LARGYDRRWSHYIEVSVRETIARMPESHPERVLDVGCGSGTLLKALRRTLPNSALTGVDMSEEMLSVARAKLDHDVKLQRGFAEALPFADGSFDLVVSTSVFHFIRAPGQALGEFARVLRPGGRVLITDWCHDFLTCRVCDLFLRIFNRSHYKIYGVRECETLLTGARFESPKIERYKIDFLWGLMTASAAKP